MQFTLTAVTAILASVAVAAPKGWQDSCKPEGTNGSCLTDEKATEIINTYETLISRSITGAEFNETTDALLDAKFFTMSNNINAEVGKEVSNFLFWMAFDIARHHAMHPSYASILSSTRR